MPTVRPVQPEDLPAITEIYAHAVTNGTASYEYDPPTLAEMTQRRDALVSANYPYIVATDDAGAILGYAYAGAFRTRPAYRFIVEDSIYIAPAAQGRGVGRILLADLIQRCEASGYRQIIAVIGDGEVNQASVKLHASLGFTPSGRITGSGYKHNHWCDTILMQLPLNGGASTHP
jgi:phosphinothricin acetyltransferase